MSEERFCSNCRAEIPEGAAVCPVCGVYAGDVFDGRMPRRKRSFSGVVVVLILVLVALLAWRFLKWPNTSNPSPVHAPAAKKMPGEAGAMLAIRQRLVSNDIPNECLALISKGLHHGSYRIHAVDRCRHRQLGDWNVDAKTHQISR